MPSESSASCSAFRGPLSPGESECHVRQTDHSARVSIVGAMATLSKTQIDKLGERLKSGSHDETDLRELDEYRRSFGDAYVHVVGLVRGRLRLAPTGRPAKSTSSIADKLRRESIRLTQIQDIAGCRLVVGDLDDQDLAVQSLVGVFPDAIVVDRRQRPVTGTARSTLLSLCTESRLRSRSGRHSSTCGQECRRSSRTWWIRR